MTTILVVDDSPSLRQVVTTSLQGKGYDVIQAENGKDALTKLDGTKINLVISDVNMPIMDGLTFVTEMKKLPRYKFTPVIMLTTEAGVDMKDKGRGAGVKAWIIKPFKPESMLTAVAKLILP